MFNDTGPDADSGTRRRATCRRAADLFSDSVYDRGAMTLQALRVEVGDATFFRILRDWFAQHRYGNATTADFIALAQRDSHRNLRGFFEMWLFTPGPVVTAPTAQRGAASRPRALAARRSTGAAERLSARRALCKGTAGVQRLHTHPKGGSHRGL